MSAWTTLSGVVIMDRNCKFSVKTYIAEKFQKADEVHLVQTDVPWSTDRCQVELSFIFSESNIAAAKLIEDFIREAKKHDPYCLVNLTALMRFLS